MTPGPTTSVRPTIGDSSAIDAVVSVQGHTRVTQCHERRDPVGQVVDVLLQLGVLLGAGR